MEYPQRISGFFTEAVGDGLAVLAGDIAASLPVCWLTFPWDLAALVEVIDQLLAELAR